ncbi:MAG: isoaspartyl peptidase/L-asparaginase, partial [Promethearchaeota archaeon]
MRKIKKRQEEALVIVHTGVSVKTPDNDKIEVRLDIARKSALEGLNALLAKDNKKIEGGSCVAAVEKSINVLEDSGVVNAGRGAVMQMDGVRRLDASIMRGIDLNFGAVMSIRKYQNPITIARKIMEKNTGHNIFAWDSAEKMMEEEDLKILMESSSQSPDIKDKQTDPNKPDSDTVGCVSRDPLGRLCSGTSTGGRGVCLPGRIGDSGIIGAGNYCNSTCGVSLTGHGENIIKLSMAKMIVDFVDIQKDHPQTAINKALAIYSKRFPDPRITVGAIAIDKYGRYGVGFKGGSMGWALVLKDHNNNFVLLKGALK